MYRAAVICLSVLVGAACSQDPNVTPQTSASTVPITPSEPSTAAGAPTAPQSNSPYAASLDDAIEAHIRRLEGNAPDFDVTSVMSADIWDFACGDIIPADADKPRKAFCALLAEQEQGVELLEFEMVGQDAPYFDWFATHGVPETIIDQ